MLSLSGDRERGGLFVAYYRVSTGKQASSGLGLDAQQRAVRAYIDARAGRLIAEFSETASGRRSNRAQLLKAISFCRIIRATLAIARLDRLSRNIDLIARLMESGLDFVATDFPQANKFTIHILAAVAEYESGLVSERTKAAMAVAKARGVELGKPKQVLVRRFPPGCQQKSAEVRRARREARARDLAPLIWKSIAEGKSYAVIADEFNELGIPVHRREPWTGQSIWRMVSLTSKEFRPKPEDAPVRRTGAAQIKVERRLGQVGPLLRKWRADRRSYSAIADELAGLGIQAPWGGRWGPGSIRRYLMRALNVATLRPGPHAAP